MVMNRRFFLNMLGMASAALALDPERLLWVPGKKKIFIPSARSDTVMVRTIYFKNGGILTLFSDQWIFAPHQTAPFTYIQGLQPFPWGEPMVV